MSPTDTHKDDGIYPQIQISLIENPSRFFAFPILGGIIKLVILIPVFLFAMILSLVMWLVVFVMNPFVVLFTGQYSQAAYDLNLNIMRYVAKITYYCFGLTNKYPGFNFSTEGQFTLEMPKPEHPSRLFAVPILGLLIRYLLMIPFMIYIYVIQMAAMIGAVIASFVIVVKGKYPESLYEMARDFVRLYMTSLAYMTGLSEKYPSFWISMNHKNVKIALIIAGILWLVSGFFTDTSTQSTQDLLNEQRRQQMLDQQQQDSFYNENQFNEYTPDDYMPLQDTPPTLEN